MRFRCDVIGVLSVLGDDDGLAWELGAEFAAGTGAQDVRLRIAVSAPEKAAVETSLNEVEALYCTGPAGGGGIRLSLRPRIATMSCFVPREAVTPNVIMQESRRG